LIAQPPPPAPVLAEPRAPTTAVALLPRRPPGRWPASAWWSSTPPPAWPTASSPARTATPRSGPCWGRRRRRRRTRPVASRPQLLRGPLPDGDRRLLGLFRDPRAQAAAVGRPPACRVWEQPVGVPDDEGKPLAVRQVTLMLDRPTGDGETEIVLLTNLPAQDADEAEVTRLHRQRWTIGRPFGEVAASLRAEIDTPSYPRAALPSSVWGRRPQTTSRCSGRPRGVRTGVGRCRGTTCPAGRIDLHSFRHTFTSRVIRAPPEQEVRNGAERPQEGGSLQPVFCRHESHSKEAKPRGASDARQPGPSYTSA
jgi:hypothetical protein